MTDILPPAGWPNVRQLETNEFASGGANGNMNEQAKSLAARSELLKQYAALPYESKTGGYALNERVQLATGDIVKSTVPNNSTNPNINMTGWFVPYMRGSQNLVELTDKATSRSNLDVYSKGEALAKNNNLSELSDKATARTNLDVYSKAETNTAISNATTPTATETVAGKAKIATTAIAQARTNDTDIITPLKLSGVIKSFYKTTPVDVTSLRTVGVLYTNPSTTNWLRVTVCFVIHGSGNYYHAQVNGNLVAKTTTSGGATWGENFTFDVPPLGTYKMLGSTSIHFWSEM